MASDANKPLDNPRRPTVVPWRVGMLIDWAYATQPMIDFVDAAKLAVEQAHVAGQIDRPVEWVERKLYGGPNAATLDVLEAFRDLVYNQKILAVIGPSLPDDMAACASDFDRAGVPVLSMGGTLSLSSPYLFQVPNGSYVDEIRMIVNHAKAAGLTSIALIRDQTMMGEEYSATFSLAMREAGLKIAGTYGINASPSMDELRGAVSAMQATRADALMIITVAIHRHFVAAMREVGWNPAKLMVCNFVAAIPEFDGPEAFEGWVGVDQFDEANPVFARMVDDFETRYGRRGGHTYMAIGYDIGRTLARGLSMMAPSTPDGLRAGLEKVRLLPAAAGAPGTVISFAKNQRRGYNGDYLVRRTVKDGVNQVIGGMLDHLRG
ncbi:ABC-type branched-chain amino acid transport system, substrate-binding protein [Sphingobium faniae]|nr:ABC-type branched-chain amino acid transport system, substrate-binding protein [Sphingobium faniae]